MKKTIFILSIIFFTSLFTFSLFAQEIDTKKIDDYITKAQKQWNIPGMAIAIVKDGKILFSKGYGVREYGKKDKVDDESLFAIASNTKAFTASALSILVDQGKINWDDPVQKYLPMLHMFLKT